MGKASNGIYIAVFSEASRLARKGYFNMNPTTDWPKLKKDLIGLTEDQLKLVLELVEHMKFVNEGLDQDISAAKTEVKS